MSGIDRMRTGAVSTWAVLSAVLLGVLADQLMRSPGEPGLNVVIWSASALALLGLLARFGARRVTLESALLFAVGWLFIATWMWRDAESVKVLSLFASAIAVTLAARHAGAAWIRRASVGDVVEAGFVAAGNSAVGAVLLARDASVLALPAGSVAVGWRRTAPAVVRGAALALPLVLVFGGLFMAADPVFARIVTDAVQLDVGAIAGHLVFTGFVAWISAGYLRGFLFGTQLPPIREVVRPPRFGVVDVGIVLGVLNLLFLLFVFVQLRYLFGGADLVAVTPGLGYADYARRGFFELVAVSALVLPVLLLMDATLHRTGSREERVFRLLAALLIVLVFAIIASALQRMRLYLDAYGLTEQRLVATVLIGWIAVVLLWFAATVLRGRRPRFASGALLAGLVAVAALTIANPHARIVRVNVARAETGAVFDPAYLSTLSADAAPALLDALPQLPGEARCAVARTMLRRWAEPPRGDWRTWNHADRRARRLVTAEAARLRAVCPSDVALVS